MSRGALTRLGIAGFASFAAADYAKDPATAVVTALATVAAGYLTNRVNAVEDEALEAARLSKNHHLQIALAGAFRNALHELNTQDHQEIFAAWDKLLDAALDDPTHRLGVVIPVDFDPLLDATNPHLDRAAAFEEIKNLLEFWLAYQRAYHQHGAYPLNPPRETPLPADLLQTLETEFPEAFQRAFAHLLVSNDQAYARRAFERGRLQVIDANTRKTPEIVKRIEKKLDGPAPPAPAKIRTLGQRWLRP